MRTEDLLKKYHIRVMGNDSFPYNERELERNYKLYSAVWITVDGKGFDFFVDKEFVIPTINVQQVITELRNRMRWLETPRGAGSDEWNKLMRFVRESLPEQAYTDFLSL